MPGYIQVHARFLAPAGCLIGLHKDLEEWVFLFARSILLSSTSIMLLVSTLTLSASCPLDRQGGLVRHKLTLVPLPGLGQIAYDILTQKRSHLGLRKILLTNARVSFKRILALSKYFHGWRELNVIWLSIIRLRWALNCNL